MVKPSLFDPRSAREVIKEAQSSPHKPSEEAPATTLAEPLDESARASLGLPEAPQKAHLFATSARVNADPLKADFRKFLFLVWEFLEFKPTDLQYNMARWLQVGPKRAIVLAFRGAAKSWITAAFALWELYCDPQKKVLVVSGSAVRAVAFTNFCLTLIRSMPLLKHLEPRIDQRQSSTAFDVAPAMPDQTPSFTARGITGQLVGLRADLVVADDVETNNNSMTPDMRSKLKDAIREFDAILKPGGSIKYLGTPQTDASIYAELPKRGYTIRVWPARYPTKSQRDAYGVKLAPTIRRAVEAEEGLVGSSTEPQRFSNEDLFQRELAWGQTGFALQYMLDTSLADISRYPLKLKNLIVLPLDMKRAPDVLTWGADDTTRIKELPVLGHDGDGYFRPYARSEATTAYNKTIMEIDPSGRGEDETAYAIMSELHANIFLRKVGGFTDGYSTETLAALAKLCVEYAVNKIRIESNFGDGMFAALLKPYISAAWAAHNKGRPEGEHKGSVIEEVQAKRVQKEHRILSALEPLLGSHRLVVCSTAIEDDFKSIKKIDSDRREAYSFAYQLTHLTYEKDCLGHDDRLDAVAGGCFEWAEMLSIDPRSLAAAAEEGRLEEALRKLRAEEDELGGYSRGEQRGGRRQGLRNAGLR